MISQAPKHHQNQSIPFNTAYFCSKSELLSWASSILDLEITNYDQTSTGAIFCQLLDACHPGTVRMNKVNWKANCETDYISNFKIFQQGLNENNIIKSIDINRLAKGKLNDLNELMQWIYGYYLSCKDNYQVNYNAKRKRAGENLVFTKKNYKKNINRKIIRDNYSQISTSSQNSFNSQESNGSDNFYYIKKNFNHKKTKKNQRKEYFNRFNNYTPNKEFDNQRLRNKSKKETKNNKYLEYEKTVLNNNLNNNNNNNDFIQTQKNNNNIPNQKNLNILMNNNNFNNNNQYFNNNRNFIQNNNDLKNTNIYTMNKLYNNINYTPQNFHLNQAKSYLPSITQNNNINFNYKEEFTNKNLDDENDDDEDDNYENELDVTDFYGLNKIETEYLIEEEKKDGEKVKNLKKIIRKLRISKLSNEKEINNIKNIINNINKLKNFYLNKLKDIEYLYFNPLIRNTNENKNTILRQILCTDKDSTIHIDENNYAFLPNKSINEIKNNINNYQKYKSQPQSCKKNIIKENDLNNINIINIKNENQTYKNNDKSIEIKYSSKKNYNPDFIINNPFSSLNENNERINNDQLYDDKEINMQNHCINNSKTLKTKNKLNDNMTNSCNITINSTKINYNSENHIDSQINNFSEFNYNNEKMKNQRIIPIKLIKENNNQIRTNSILMNNEYNQNQNNINNNVLPNERINNNFKSEEVHNDNIQLIFQNNLNNDVIENDYFDKKNNLKYNGGKSQINSEEINIKDRCEEEEIKKYNEKKFNHKTEFKNNINYDIIPHILNESLHIKGI